MQPKETKPLTQRKVKMFMEGSERLFSSFGRARREFSNWWWVLPLAALSVPSRLPPTGGVPRLARTTINLRLRTGVQVSCQLNEVYFWFEVFGMGVYDIPQIQWSRIQTIVDIGANTGAASMWFSQLASSASILAIEPGQDTSDRLRSNLMRNGLLGKVEVVRLAVGKENGVGYLISGEHSALARTQSVPEAGAEIVELAGLERVVELAGGRIDLMKIDCEGGEYGFFESAPLELLRKIGSIVGEYHPANSVEQANLFQHLELSGFKCLVTPDGHIDGLEQGTFMAWRDGCELPASGV